ncbi:MAG: hypothetical protein C4520_12010 [Candidatus Abyssobacteria bacterium SURF_5]|uniref:Uncharacterized protein n=1 Tax=Abyssobacteria bacterium (strain SURF_5) TaxID=2093360 RepID=A0A3A4NP32_ABYX5|nr:MAG: hypothetical protein C4520_12010 [Candidatus Abyssubacteria bacterium SURF_5]
MYSEKTAPMRIVNIEECLYCVYYQALGCAGSLKFCTYLNVLLEHGSGTPRCRHMAPIEGADRPISG